MARTRRSKYAPREMRLVAEWAGKNFPRDRFEFNVRVGQVHPSLHPESLSPPEVRMVGVWRRMADCVVVQDDKVLLVEATIKPDPGHISLLNLYARLFPMTPEYQSVSVLPLKKILLMVLKDPVVEILARESDVRVVYYRPSWVDDYLSTLDHRSGRAPLTVLP